MARPRKKNNLVRKSTAPEHRLDERIRVAEVRVVGDNIEQGVYPTRKALVLAQSKSLDLVEIVPTPKPPVCKIIRLSF